MSFVPGRVYILRFADSYHGGPQDAEVPECGLHISGLYEGDIFKDGIYWMAFSNWWSGSDAEHDIREMSYVLKESIAEYWDVTPTKPGTNPHSEPEEAEEDENLETAATMPSGASEKTAEPRPSFIPPQVPYVG